MTPTLIDEALAQVRAIRELPAPDEARRLREAFGLTQQQIGDAIGVDRATICRWESGERRPRGPMACLYLAVLNRVANATLPTDYALNEGRLPYDTATTQLFVNNADADVT